MAIKPRLPSMSANSQTCPELLVQPRSPHLFSHCSTEADKLLHHPDLGRTAGSMGCNRAGGGGYSWEPGQTHLPLDQSHFPFLSLNLSLLVLLSLSSVLFKENGYVMGKFNSMRNHLQHSEHKYYTCTRNNSGSTGALFSCDLRYLLLVGDWQRGVYCVCRAHTCAKEASGSAVEDCISSSDWSLLCRHTSLWHCHSKTKEP